MSTTGNSSDKALKGLTSECYRRIHNWHANNKQRILDKLSYRKRDDPYVTCYQGLVAHLPDPEEATRSDIPL